MFSRRVLTRATASAPTTPLIRPFCNASRLQRAPALSDIQPNNAEAFDKKQQGFRDDLTARVKKQRDMERQSTSTTPAAGSAESLSSSTLPDNDVTMIKGEGLGSLSTATGETARKQDEASNKKKPGSGRLSNLIYGTEEGREMDREIERSFSQVLARGKYVHSIVFHEVKPDKVDEYVELVGSWYPRMASTPENKVHLVGSWRTEVGDCDTFGRFEPWIPGPVDLLITRQCTSGSINATRATTHHFTTFNTTQSSLPLMQSLRRSSTARRLRLCKSSASGRHPHPVN